MKLLPFSINFLLLIISTQFIYCCESVPYTTPLISIPATGNSWVINDNSLNSKIITKSGITNWTETSTRIRTYFRVEKAGILNLALRAKVSSGSSTIVVSTENEKKTISLSNNSFDTISAGTFNIEKAGYQWIEFQGIDKTGPVFADVTTILVGGAATEDKIYFVKDDFYFGRRGPSVHLKYEIPAEASDIVWFYNEITIPAGNDVIGSYFMADGFADGYFGIQVNSSEERRILFSVWSPYKTDNPGEIPDDYKIILLKKGEGVITKEFGNEGSGGQSYRKFFWKAGVTYKFLLKGQPVENNSTDYTAYFFAPEINKWELIAGFRRPKTSSYLKNLYSFLENFLPDNGNITRKGYFSNQWLFDKNGKWTELSIARFTADATARKESRLDYSGGVENGNFYLRNCGFFSDKSMLDILITRPKTNDHPLIDFSQLE